MENQSLNENVKGEVTLLELLDYINVAAEEYNLKVGADLLFLTRITMQKGSASVMCFVCLFVGHRSSLHIVLIYTLRHFKYVKQRACWPCAWCVYKLPDSIFLVTQFVM